MLAAFRDEFPKQPTLMFAVLSDAVPGDIDVDDVRRSSCALCVIRCLTKGQTQAIRKALNDALCLHGLNELSSMTIPLQSPSNWRPGPWTAELTTDVSHRPVIVMRSVDVRTKCPGTYQRHCVYRPFASF